MKYGERLKAARTYARLTQGQLAERLKNVVSQANISYLENSDATGSEYTVQFAIECGVKPAWLATGIGSMTEGSQTGALTVREEAPRYHTDEQIAALIRSLPADAKHLMAELAILLSPATKPDGKVATAGETSFHKRDKGRKENQLGDVGSGTKKK